MKKTAEEIREEIAIAEGCTSFAFLIATDDLSIGEKLLEVDRCMKIYGRQCAEQALKDALNRAYLAPSDNFDDISKAIEGAKIVTP